MTGHIQKFDPHRVKPLPGQPRKRFRRIQELADSITEIGQSCPGIVTLLTGDPDFDAQLVDGERRLRACKLAGVKFRAEVREDGSDEEIFVASFGANFGKQDHDVLEIAEGLDRMQRSGKTLEQMARIAGRSVPWVQSHLNFLKLHPHVQKMMISEDEEPPKIAFSIAQLLVPMDEQKQLQMAQKIANGPGISMAAMRRMILRERHRGGDKHAYTGDRGTKRSISTIESILEDTGNRIGVYLDMPGPQLNTLIDALDNSDKRKLMESIGDAIDNLAGLKSAIERRLPKLHVRQNA